MLIRAILIAGLLYNPAIAQELCTNGHLPPRPLCKNGWPTPRPRGVTYGGLFPQRGYERDHCIPLGLCGDDLVGNVWYQPLPEAKRKNTREDDAIEEYCAGQITLEQAQAMFPKEKCVVGAW